MAGNHWKKVEH